MKPLFRTFLWSLFLLFLAGQSSYGFSSKELSTAASYPERHSQVTDRVNDQAIGVEQLTLAEPESLLQAQEELPADTLNFLYFGAQTAWSASVGIDLSYAAYSELITPSLSRLKLIFPFHLFP